MKSDDLTPGAQWLIETLQEDMHMRGWLMKSVTEDEYTRGMLHITLTDRYGRTYNYRVMVSIE